jgi:undecaprenyl-diphosphatase
MKIADALILGLLQGLSEFLPISSSGHLFLANRLGIISGEMTLFYAIMLHVGSLAAVVAVFWDKVKYVVTHPLSDMTKYILLACIPTAILAGLFRFLLSEAVEGALLPLGFFLTTGLLAGSAFVRHRDNRMDYLSALITGLAQGCAVLPGLSRSGTTITAALMCGVNREEAGEFSFLISIPIIIGSALVEGLQYSGESVVGNLGATVVGVAASFVAGYLALFALKNIIRKAKLYYFAPYTFALGILSLFV